MGEFKFSHKNDFGRVLNISGPDYQDEVEIEIVDRDGYNTSAFYIPSEEFYRMCAVALAFKEANGQ